MVSSRVSTRASAKYLGHPTALYRGEDGILWRVPMQRARDEAVPIPVEDLVQARGAVDQLKRMVERGGFDEVDLEMLGHLRSRHLERVRRSCVTSTASAIA